MRISDKNINIFANMVLSAIVAMVYIIFQTNCYYGAFLRIMVGVGLVPVLSFGLITFRTTDIRFAVLTLVLYQTWNMFLQPYLWADPISSIYRMFSSKDFPMMSVFCALSIWAMYLGSLYGIAKVKTNPMFESKYMDNRQIERVLKLLILGGVAISIFQEVISYLGIPFGLFGLIETMLPATVGAIAVLYWLRGGRNIFYIVLVAIYMVYYFIYYVGGTLFVYCIFLVLAPVVTYMLETRRIPYKTVLLVTILLMPIFITRHTYRNEGLYSRGIERIAVGMQILANEYGNISWDKFIKLREKEKENYNVDNRTEGVTYLATVIRSIDSGRANFVYGETMVWFPTMVLPRFLIPFRPPQNMGDQWAIYYGLKDPSWRASINFPMLCEFYANFGYFGMLFFSFLCGILVVWFMRKFNDGVGDLNLLLLIFVVSKIVVVEANISLGYGAILQVMTVCWLYKKVKA
jgi:hypothetical protein